MLCQGHQWRQVDEKYLYKPSIVPDKTHKALDVGKTKENFDLIFISWIDHYTFTRDNVTKKSNQSQPRFTFIEFSKSWGYPWGLAKLSSNGSYDQSHS